MRRAGSLCVALLAARALAVDAGVPRKVYKWDVPQVIEETSVPERLYAIDYPVTVHAVKTTLKPKALVDNFARQFQKAGLYINPEEDTPGPLRSLSITGLDTETLISYTIIFQGNDDGTTTAIMTETYMGERRKQPPPAPSAFTSVFPGATGVVRSGSEGMQTLNYTAPGRPDEVTTFYRETLGKAGFKAIEPDTYFKAGETLQIHVRAGKGDASIVTVIQRLGER